MGSHPSLHQIPHSLASLHPPILQEFANTELTIPMTFYPADVPPFLTLPAGVPSLQILAGVTFIFLKGLTINGR